MTPKKSPASIFQFALIFAAVFLLSNAAMKYFFPEKFGGEKVVEASVSIHAQDPTLRSEHHPVIVVKNTTDTAITLTDRCPMPPLLVWKVDENNVRTPLETTETVRPCVPLLTIPADSQTVIDLAPWKYSLFNELGIYEVELPVAKISTGSVATGTGDNSQYREGIIARFSIYQAGTATQIFRTFVTKPLLNFLILIASIIPGHDLGLAIILLTIIIKLLLFFPTQHAMEGQRKLQAAQPLIQELQKKYKDDPKKLQAETMRIWKERKINPMQSCLPMLIQFPILFGLYFVVRDGSHLELSKHLIYDVYQNLPWTFDVHFLSLNLSQPNFYILPPLLVILQFIQMKLSFTFAKRKKEAREGKKEEPKEKEPLNPQDLQQKMMMYMLPLMIGFFALKFPAAVSIYWGISTLFGIGQQVVVNRKVG